MWFVGNVCHFSFLNMTREPLVLPLLPSSKPRTPKKTYKFIPSEIFGCILEPGNKFVFSSHLFYLFAKVTKIQLQNKPSELKVYTFLKVLTYRGAINYNG